MLAADLLLSLVWLALGLLVAGLACAARWDLGARGVLRGARGVWSTLALSALSAVVGGWLGALLFGRLYGAPMALWVSVVACALLPFSLKRLQR